MRKFLLLLFLAISLGAGAQTSAFLSFSSSAVATSSGNRLIGSGTTYHALSWSGQGTLSTCQVRVDSSIDGVTWNAGDVIAAQTCTTNGSVAAVSGVYNYIRINVTTISGGGTITPVYIGYFNNPGAGSNPVLGSGTVALGTSAIASGACATVVTAAVTGVTRFAWVFTADPTATTGYVASANGMLTIVAYATTNTLNWKVCNNTASSITPGAASLAYTAF